MRKFSHVQNREKRKKDLAWFCHNILLHNLGNFCWYEISKGFILVWIGFELEDYPFFVVLVATR